MFWVIAGFMAAGAVVLIVRALTARQHERTGSVARELDVCRAQLAELERDLEAGLVTAEDAAASRTAIERRLLQADKQREAGTESRSPAASARARMAAVVIVALTPAAAVGLYLMLGHPGKVAPPQDGRQASTDPGSAPRGAAASRKSAPGLDELAVRLEERLEKSPEDSRGWGLLGRTYSVLGQYPKAAWAYGKAVALQPGAAELQSGLGEALALSADGQVTPEALEAFKRAKALDPADSASRFYLGMADYQRGKFRAALDAWAALAKDAPPDAPWLPDLRRQIAAVARELGLDPNSVLPKAAPADGTARAAGEMNRLAALLQESPKDYEGWMRLARLRAATGDKAGARSAIDAGLEAFPDAPFVRRMLERTAAELGLESGGAALAVRRGPSREDMRAAAELSDEQRRDMIKGMVAGLAARLEANPDDTEGWRMLARSYRVLGEPEKAAEARRRLAELRPEDASAQAEYALALVQFDESKGGRIRDKTVAAWRRVIRMEEDHAQALFYLGKAAGQRGDRATAEQHLQRLIRQLPSAAPLRKEAEALLKGWHAEED